MQFLNFPEVFLKFLQIFCNGFRGCPWVLSSFALVFKSFQMVSGVFSGLPGLVVLRRPMLAKPELLVFCGLESGVARQPRNLGFVLALSCRSLRSHASSSGKLTNVASMFSVVAQREVAC